MKILLILLVLIALGIIHALMFVLGAKIGQKAVKGEEIKLPSINPLEAYRNHEARKEAEAEQDKIETIIQNIECYDGTGRGQKDVN